MSAGAPPPSRTRTTSQQAPTSPRIHELLARAMTRPETLTLAEIREIAASVISHILSTKTG